MPTQQSLQAVPPSLQQSKRPLQARARRCYLVADLLVLLRLSKRSFFALRRAGRLPMLEELTPRLGRIVRYRADLVDRYLAGQWNQPRAFASGRRAHSSDATPRFLARPFHSKESAV